jgi:hypothetical protein
MIQFDQKGQPFTFLTINKQKQTIISTSILVFARMYFVNNL